jgi:hypothetical protein
MASLVGPGEHSIACRSHASPPTKFAGPAEERALGLRLVPHALELCGLGGNASTVERLARVSRNRAALAACLGLGLERAKLRAKDNDPERVTKLARIRLLGESLRPRQALLFADELDIHLLPQSGYQWMRKVRRSKS